MKIEMEGSFRLYIWYGQMNVAYSTSMQLTTCNAYSWCGVDIDPLPVVRTTKCVCVCVFVCVSVCVCVSL